VIKPGTRCNEIISHQDWLPTLLAAAGEPDITTKLRTGHQVGTKTFRVHLDGYNFLPHFRGEAPDGPREEYFYFSQGGELNAMRVRNWKIHFAVQRGNVATSTRGVTAWPTLVHLRADPFERAPEESGMYIRWYAENMWAFIPAQDYIQRFFAGFNDYPHQAGMSLNAAGINYQSLRAMDALKHLDEIRALPAARN
jgi:arylsulfatase